ncbi:MAG: hypothetical protein OHK0046_42130 [Anaerolineae bacterium]
MKYIVLLGRGILIWLVPFVVSFFFYTPEGDLAVSYAWFKSTMVVVLTLVTLAVNLIRPPFGFGPVMVATVYTAVSVVLDLVTIVPMLGFTAYVEQVALIYIIIPTLTWSILARHAATAASPLAAQ